MIDDLFSKIFLRSKATVVFGNLGRYPNILNYYLSHYDEKNCSRLILEPDFGAHVPLYDVVILASHLNLNVFPSAKIEIFHVGKGKYDTSNLPHDRYVSNKNFSYKIIPELEFRPEEKEYSNVDDGILVDLSEVEDPNEMYLRLLTFCDHWVDGNLAKYYDGWSVVWPKLSTLKKLNIQLDASHKILKNKFTHSSEILFLEKRYLLDPKYRFW
jgi:hypothetical protein